MTSTRLSVNTAGAATSPGAAKGEEAADPADSGVGLDSAAVDRALDRLRRPTTVQDRLEVLQQLVHFWHGPIEPGDGMSDAELAGVQMPMPLRWWYRWAGKRSEVMSGQNFLFEPRNEQRKNRQLAVEDGRLNFYIENQGVYHWSTLPEGDDPPVFGRYKDTDPWEQENITLSEHLILACLFEALTRAEYAAWTDWLDEQKFAEIVARAPPVAIGAWRWMGFRFFAGQGVFMCAGDNFEFEGRIGCSVWIAAKTEHPLQFLKPFRSDDWRHMRFESAARPAWRATVDKDGQYSFAGAL